MGQAQGMHVRISTITHCFMTQEKLTYARLTVKDGACRGKAQSSEDDFGATYTPSIV